MKFKQSTNNTQVLQDMKKDNFGTKHKRNKQKN